MKLSRILARFLRPKTLATHDKPARRRLAIEPLEDRTLLATFTVTNGNNSGAGSLRAAIAQAESNAGADIVDFDGVTTVNLSSDIVANETVTINGGNGVTISGGNSTRVFTFGTNGTNTFTLNNLTVTNGNGASSTANGLGGAIFIGGPSNTVVLNDSTVRNSSANNGGGIVANFGNIILNRSTLSGNTTAGQGGAIFTQSGDITVNNSTISGNSASTGAAFILSSSGSGNRADGILRNATIAQNTSSNGNAITMSQTNGSTSTLNYRNSIFANANTGGANFGIFSGTATSQGNNISSDASGNLNQGSDHASTNPMINTTLASNGGPTQTHALLQGSDAIDGGANLSGQGITTDQRGISRPQGAAFDIGAFEVETITVTNGNDSGAGSLRAAIAQAESNAGADIVDFNGVTTVNLSSDIVANETITINGGNGVTISGGNSTRIFTFGTNGTNTFTLNNLTVTNGNGASSTANGLGGAIFIGGPSNTVVLNDSTVRNSSANNGGGIVANFGNIILNRSTLSGNTTAGQGGAIFTQSGDITVNNSTISGNSASTGAAFILSSSGSGNRADGVLRNATIAQNTSSNGNAITMSQTNGSTSTLNYRNSIFSNANTGGVNIGVFSGTATSLGNNISSDASGNLNQGSDHPSTNPMINTTLANNGGPTQTHALLQGSDAIDGGANLSGQGITTDQRGITRPQGSAFDIGAFEVALDYGDAPDTNGATSAGNYQTLVANNGARHFPFGPRLGATVQGENDGEPDDESDRSIDDDGISLTHFPFGFAFFAGAHGTMLVDLQNANPTSNRLDGWIDFNNDGDWQDAGEHVFNNVDLGTTNGKKRVNFMVPANVQTNSSAHGDLVFARLRVSTAGNLSPLGLASNGEVEDIHLHIYDPIMMGGLDFGDAPDSGVGTGTGNYQTLLADNGARHVAFDGDFGMFLGATRDAETNGQPNATATGDDAVANPNVDDEDGVNFTSQLIGGQNATVSVTAKYADSVVAPGDGFLNAWVDFNNDGDFDDAGEQIFTDRSLADGVNALTFAVPQGVGAGDTFARFRFSSATGIQPNGLAPDGEVEDYQVTISNPNTPDSIGVFRSTNGRWYQDVGTNGTIDNSFTFGANGDTPIVGDWDGDGVDDVGIHRKSNALIALDIGNNGSVNRLFRFGAANTDQVFVGKFDNDAIDDLLIYRPSQARFFFDLGANGTLDRFHKFGANNLDQVHIGDFNNDGIDDVLVYRPSNARFFFDLSANGTLDSNFKFGANNIDTVLVGNFDGTGGDDIAIQRSSQARYFFDLGANGTVDRSFRFGANNIDNALVGDLNGDGTDDLILHRPSAGRFFVDHGADGTLNQNFRFGATTDTPVIGAWAAPLLATSENQSNDAGALNNDDLAPVVNAAIGILSNQGLTTSEIATLNSTTVKIDDLSGAQLGAAINSTIIIDVNAAGHGWFVDTTPNSNEEFADLGNDGLIALAGSAAHGQVDLLTVVLHELNHILGHDHFDEDHGLLNAQLGLGIRRN